MHPVNRVKHRGQNLLTKTLITARVMQAKCLGEVREREGGGERSEAEKKRRETEKRREPERERREDKEEEGERMRQRENERKYRVTEKEI